MRAKESPEQSTRRRRTYGILGSLEVLEDGRAITLSAKQKAVLAILLLHANEVVSRDRLIEEIWPSEPPDTSRAALQVYVSQLRKTLGREVISTRSPGYAVNVEDRELDLTHFERLVESARGQEPAAAANTLRDALELWRGTPLPELEGTLANVERSRLEEQRLAALELRIDAELELGRHAELVPEVEALVKTHPLRERLRGQLMLALYRSGRQAEALAAYREGRRLLDEELGLEPGEELRHLERAILEQDASINVPGKPVVETPTTVPPRRSRQLLGLGAATVVTAAVAVIVAIQPWATASHAIGADNQVVGLDGSGNVDHTVAIAGSPAALVSSGSSLWVAEPGPRMLERVNAPTGKATDRVPLPTPPGAMTVFRGGVWVASTTGGIVLRIAQGRVTQTVTIGAAGAAAIGSGTSGLWAADATDRTLVQIDPVKGVPERRIALDFSPAAIAVDRFLWVVDYDTGVVRELDPQTEQELGSVHVGNGPVAVTTGAGAVWVANSLDGTVSQIDPHSLSVVRTIPVGDGPTAVVVGAGSVWVANRYSGTLSRIRPGTNDVKPISVGSRPAAIAVDGNRVWVGSGAAGAGHRGGTLILETTDCCWGYLSDPAEYDRALPTQFTGLAYDTLVTFQHVDGPAGLDLVPDLAVAIPKPSDGGRTYAFRIHRGIRYSNGRVVRAKDFRRAFERLWKVPAGASPPSGAARYMDIVGMKRCNAFSCDLSHGIVTDDAAGTVIFHLTKPNPDFLDSLTNFAFSAPIPAGTPDPSTETLVPGTGPYRITSATDGLIRFVRNPYFKEWSAAAQPDGYPDAIVWKAALPSQEAVVNAVESGRADWTFDTIPAARLKSLLIRAPEQVHANPWYLFEYIALNPHVAPFDDPRVREALNYAIDRRKIVRMYGGRHLAASSCQALVGGLPGYERYCPYTLHPSSEGFWKAPDLARARRLVAASGERGRVVDVFKTTELGTPSQLPAYVANVLRSLGFHVVLHQPTNDISQEQQLYVHGDWVADWPEPSAYMQGFFSCGGAYNVYSICDRALDRKMALATSLQRADPKRAADLWAQVDRTIVKKAWWVPTVTPLGVDLVSPRVGNYRFHPLWGFMADQAWVR